MGRKSQGEPQFTQATYAKRKPKRNPPSPARVEAAREVAKMDAANERVFHKDPAKWILQKMGFGKPKP